jgi:calcium-dependent protein kinase
LLCGYPPFNGGTDEIIMKKIQVGSFDFQPEDWNHISKEAKIMIRKMLEYDPASRYSAEQALQDPWLKRWTHEKVEKPVILKILTNLRAYQAKHKLQEIMWMFLVSYLSTKEERNELLKTFKQLDTNNDGVLSREEILIGLKNYMNLQEAEEETERIFKAVDVNASGSLDYSEFVMATINRNKLLNRQSLETAFKYFDKVILPFYPHLWLKNRTTAASFLGTSSKMFSPREASRLMTRFGRT